MLGLSERTASSVRCGCLGGWIAGGCRTRWRCQGAGRQRDCGGDHLQLACLAQQRPVGIGRDAVAVGCGELLVRAETAA
jgi:hypothetical protein